MKKTITLLALLSLIIISFDLQRALAQEVSDVVRITTTDGNIFTGTVLEADDQRVVIQVEGVGEIALERSRIRNIQVIDPDRIRNGDYWFENPQGTRYFFAPNAIGLKRGTGYYQNTWIFFNNVNYGVTNNFSIGAGTIPVFLFGVSALPIWVLPKVSVPVRADNIHIAGGALLGGVIGEGSGGFGLAYGNVTFGNKDKNLTVGAGYGYAGAEWSDTPLINISGLYRSGKNFQWLAEIYFVPGIDGSGAGIFGGRWAPERFAVDFGLARPITETGGIIGIPWLGVTIPFGN